VKHLLFVSSEVAAETLRVPSGWHACLHVPSCAPCSSVRRAAACPCAASAAVLCRARVIRSLIPLACSLNAPSTSDWDSLPPPPRKGGSRCSSQALNEPFVRGGSCGFLIWAIAVACGGVKSLGVSSRTRRHVRYCFISAFAPYWGKQSGLNVWSRLLLGSGKTYSVSSCAT